MLKNGIRIPITCPVCEGSGFVNRFPGEPLYDLSDIVPCSICRGHRHLPSQLLPWKMWRSAKKIVLR